MAITKEVRFIRMRVTHNTVLCCFAPLLTVLCVSRKTHAANPSAFTARFSGIQFPRSRILSVHQAFRTTFTYCISVGFTSHGIGNNYPCR